MFSPPASSAMKPLRTHVSERIGPLRDINEQCLLWMIEALREYDGQRTGLLAECGGMLASLSATQRYAVAGFPFLLVDMRFQEPLWWAEIARRPSQSTPVPSWLPAMPSQSTIRLARSVLVLVWHTTRIDRDAATVLLGLHADTTEVLTRLHLHDLDKVAENQFGRLRPRWEDRPFFWKHLLSSIAIGRNRDNSDVVLRALQLVAGSQLVIRADSLPGPVD